MDIFYHTMSLAATEIIENFREEHRFVRDTLLEISDAARNQNAEKVDELVDELIEATGPHFRYEEESLYPNISKFVGEDRVSEMLSDHDIAIAAVEEMKALVDDGSLTEEEGERIAELTQAMMTHVQDCDGIAVLMENLSDQEMDSVADVVERSNEEGVPLLEWADTIRDR